MLSTLNHKQRCVQVDRQSCAQLKGLSTGCRHLLTRLLRADPKKRATASEIMRHPWFQTDCPQVIFLFLPCHKTAIPVKDSAQAIISCMVEL